MVQITFILSVKYFWHWDSLPKVFLERKPKPPQKQPTKSLYVSLGINLTLNSHKNSWYSFSLVKWPPSSTNYLWVNSGMVLIGWLFSYLTKWRTFQVPIGSNNKFLLLTFITAGLKHTPTYVLFLRWKPYGCTKIGVPLWNKTLQ